MEQTIVQVNCSPNLYDAARKKMKSVLMNKYNINVDDYETQIRLIQKNEEIKNGILNLKFDLSNQARDSNSETPIVNNDIFIPFGIALGFVKTPLISGTQYESIENQQIIYFNSETVFTYTATGAVSQAKALESLYYSKASFLSGGGNIINEFPARELKRVPQGKVDGFYYYQNGKFFMMTEFPFLDGSNKNEVKFDVPSADTASASGNPATEKTYAILQLMGFNISGLSKDYKSLGCKIKCVD